MKPELTQDDFAKAVEVQFRGQHDLQNIVLARGPGHAVMYILLRVTRRYWALTYR